MRSSLTRTSAGTEAAARVDRTGSGIKMAAVAICAELKLRDGTRERVGVVVKNDLSSLISGIKDLTANVSQLLSELVEREKGRGDSAEGEFTSGLKCFFCRIH